MNECVFAHFVLCIGTHICIRGQDSPVVEHVHKAFN